MSAADFIAWGTETALAVSCLIGLILLIRRPFSRAFGAGAAYALWLLPLARLFMPGMTLKILPAQVPDSLPVLSAPAPDVMITVGDMTTSGGPDMFSLFIMAWICGAILWLAGQVFRQKRFERALHQDSDPAPEHLVAAATCLADELGVKVLPALRVSHIENGPLVFGLLHPTIILPAGFEDRFTPEQQDWALSHELMHVKRRDLIGGAVALLFRALNWFNPLVHMAAAKFRADQEAACDASVLRQRAMHPEHDRAGYAETLLQAAYLTRSRFTPAPLGLTAHHPLKERLMRMTTDKSRTSRSARAASGMAILLALAVSAPITLAAGEGETLAGGSKDVNVDIRSSGKQVIKWTETNDDGETTHKHYEIVTEGDETQAWEIDYLGNRTRIDPSEIDNLRIAKDIPVPPKPPGLDGSGNTLVTIRKFTKKDGAPGQVMTRKVTMGKTFKIDEDGRQIEVEKHISPEMMETLLSKTENQFVFQGPDGEWELKDLPNGQDVQVFTFSSDDALNVERDGMRFAYGHGEARNKAMINAAQGMISGLDDSDMSRKAKRELEKARKALKAAQEAMKE